MAARSKPTTNEAGTDESGLPSETRLDSDVHAPATNAPGDAPADTTDPTERASTIPPQAPSAEALRAGTILGAIPVPDDVVPTVVHGVTGADGEERVEEYDTVDPQGNPIRIRRFLDGPNAGQSIRI